MGRLVDERTAELHAAQESLREDIRRRELVEAALRKSEDRYRAFVEQSSEGVWRFEHEPPISIHLPVEEQIELMYRHARLSECNDVMARMYGYERCRATHRRATGGSSPPAMIRNWPIISAPSSKTAIA